MVVARVPSGESILWPPSHCRTCGRPVSAGGNVPILSWFMLGGRCPGCLGRFSMRYALVELAFALVCAFAVARHGLSLPAAKEVVLMGFLIPLALIDLDTWLLPHVITKTGVAAGLFVSLAAGWEELLWNGFAAALGYASLALLGLILEKVMKREAIGGGDPWLLSMIGAFLGLRALFAVVLLSSVQGSLIGVLLVLSRRRAAKPQESRTDANAATAPAQEVPKTDDAPEAKGTETAKDEEEEDWTPPPTAIPYGPFLSLGAAEVLYFTELPRLFLPF